MKRRTAGRSLIVVFLSLLFIVYLFPLFVVVLNSFKSDAEVVTTPLALPKRIGFSNYVDAFERMRFASAFGNSLLITVVSVLLITVLSAMCAYSLAREKGRFSTVVYLVLVASMIMPFRAIMIPPLRAG